MKDLVIVGAGSIANEVLSFIKKYNLYNVICFAVDRQYMNTDRLFDLPVYPLDELKKMVPIDETEFFIAIAFYNYMNKYKREMYERLKPQGYKFANLISPKADVCSSSIGEGNWINDYAYLAFGSKIGNNNTFVQHSIVSHSTQMADHNVVSARAIIAGSCLIGNQNYFGVNSTVFNKLKIGNKCIVGGGSVVKKDLPDFTMVVAPDSYYKQCDEDKIETYISLEHIKKSNQKFKENN